MSLVGAEYYRLAAVALISTLIVSTLITTIKHYNDQQLISNSRALYAAILFIFIVSSAVEWLRFVGRRRELHRLFARSNVPHLARPKLFSGNFFETFGQERSTFIVHEHHRRLGPTFGMFFGPDPWILTCDLELLQRVFTERPVNINQSQFNLPFVTEINESLGQVNGDKWRQARRIIAPSFTHKQMQMDNVYDEIERVGEQLIEGFEAHRQAAAARAQEARLDVYYAMKKYSLEVIFRLAFGRQHNERLAVSERDELIDWIDGAAEIVNGFSAHTSILFAPLRRLLGLFAPFTLLGSLIAQVHAIVDDSLEARLRLYAEVGQPEFKDRRMIDSLIESKRSGRMERTVFKANLFFILIAGYETSSFTLTCLLFHLAWAQDEQEKLRQALHNHGERAHYLDWCILEALRLHPSVPNGVGRILEHDIEHKGMLLRKGMSVNASIYSIHHSRDYWGPDADQFRPERMGEPVDEAARPELRLRQFGFGHGPRYCVGQNLAMAEMRAVISRLVVAYRIGPSQTTPRQLNCLSKNIIHWIIDHPVELEFTQISTL